MVRIFMDQTLASLKKAYYMYYLSRLLKYYIQYLDSISRQSVTESVSQPYFCYIAATPFCSIDLTSFFTYCLVLYSVHCAFFTYCLASYIFCVCLDPLTRRCTYYTLHSMYYIGGCFLLV